MKRASGKDATSAQAEPNSHDRPDGGRSPGLSRRTEPPRIPTCPDQTAPTIRDRDVVELPAHLGDVAQVHAIGGTDPHRCRHVPMLASTNMELDLAEPVVARGELVTRILFWADAPQALAAARKV